MKKFYPFVCYATFILLASAVTTLNAQTITTVAGQAGYLGDGNAAVNAILPSPYAMTRDSSGNIYFTEVGDGHIRQINIATGVVQTFAGSTGNFYYGDGGFATQALFNFTKNSGLASDKNGNLYVGDCANNRIREIAASTGIVTTIAGTGTAGYNGDNRLATGAEVNGAEGIVLDAAGDIYFSDVNNNLIRRIDASTKNITTVAGIYLNDGNSGDNGLATSAAIGVVERIAIDGAGNLYLADKHNNVVRKIDATTKKITTIAGNGTPGYLGDGGLATAAEIRGLIDVYVDAAGNVYITDQTDGVVREIDATTQDINTIAGTGLNGYSGDGGLATAAQLDMPTDVDIDGAGNIFIADEVNNRIREIDAASKIITTIGGTGAWGPADSVKALNSNFYFPGQIAFDTSGNLYAGDFYKVRMINMATDTITSVAGGGTSTASGTTANNLDIEYMHPVAVDNNNNLYLTDESLYRVIKVDAQTKIATYFAGNGDTTETGNGGPATSAGIKPLYLATDSAGDVFISDFKARVWEVKVGTPTITAVAGTGEPGYSGDNIAATSAKINNGGMGVAVDKAGNLYIADIYSYRIRRVDAQTGIITTVAGTGTSGFDGDNGLAVNAQLAFPRSITLDANGDIFIADSNRIRKISAGSGIITTVAGTITAGYGGDNGPAVSAQLNAPYDLKFDTKGQLYISDIGNHVIRRISGSLLPVSYLSFTGIAKGANVLLNWQTANEINTAYFNVERSSDGIRFTNVGQVTAEGDNNSINNYSFVDAGAANMNVPALYYRLEEVDKDGVGNYSNIALVKLGILKFDVQVSPNPVADVINLYPSADGGNADIMAVDMSGKIISRSTTILLGGQPVHIDASRFAAGMYYIIVKTLDTQVTLKIIK